jgi:hypothetical protein
MSPKIFVSHASEDKDRFVLRFAERLRQKGIDAWLDKWEMLPGDSLVDKIFEEGIKEATAVIIILSKFSVEKPWVKEELNAAFVKRINNGSKLIPIVIDDCDVPESLKSTLWESIADLTAYDSSFDRIVASIFGVNDKPPIGSAPEYVQSFVQAIGELNNIDSLVLRLSCEEALKSGDVFIKPGHIFLKDGKPLVPEEELEDSLEILDSNGYIKLIRTIGRDFAPYRITTYGFDVYANAAIPAYQEKIATVVSAIVNENLTSNAKIQARLKENIVIVDHILSVLENMGHIKQAKMVGGLSQIFNVSPSLKRALRGS